MTFPRYFNPCATVRVAGQFWRSDGPGDLAIAWQIRRDNTLNPDQGTITIHNPSSKRAREVVELWRSLRKGFAGLKAEIRIGWDGIFARAAFADVILARYYRDPIGQRLVIQIGDGELSFGRVTPRFYSGQTIALLIEQLVRLPAQSDGAKTGGLGLEYPAASRSVVAAASGSAKVTTIPPHVSTAETLRNLLSMIGCEGRVHDGQFIVTRGKQLNTPGMVFRPRNGRSAFASREDGGCDMVTLGDPQMQPGLQFQVVTDEGRDVAAPYYRCESVEFTGNTYEARSEMRVLGALGVLL